MADKYQDMESYLYSYQIHKKKSKDERRMNEGNFLYISLCYTDDVFKPWNMARFGSSNNILLKSYSHPPQPISYGNSIAAHERLFQYLFPLNKIFHAKLPVV